MIILMNGKPYNLPGSRCNEKQLKKCSLILLVSSPWHWSALFNLSNHRFPRMLWWFYSSISFLWAFVHRLKQTNKPWCQESWLLGWGSSEVNALKCWRQMPGVSLYFPCSLAHWHPCSPSLLSIWSCYGGLYVLQFEDWTSSWRCSWEAVEARGDLAHLEEESYWAHVFEGCILSPAPPPLLFPAAIRGAAYCTTCSLPWRSAGQATEIAEPRVVKWNF